MNRLLRIVVLLLTVFAVTACIHEVDPESGNVEISCSQEFKAFADGDLVWVLDKDIVGKGRDYTFEATEVGSHHILKVKESKSLFNETRTWKLTVVEGCEASAEEDPVVEEEDPVVEEEDPVVEEEDPVVEEEDPVVEEEDPVVEEEDPEDDIPVLEDKTICDPNTAQATEPCGVGACAGNVGTMTCSADGLKWEETKACDPMAGAVELPECKKAGITLDGDINCNGTPDDEEVSVCMLCTPGEEKATEACGVGACEGNTGTLTCSEDGLEWVTTAECDPMAGAVELSECKEAGTTLDGDINCNGTPDDQEVEECKVALAPPIVDASDIESGITNCEVTWNAVEGATYYKVYQAQEADGEYVLLADDVTDPIYVFEEDYVTDVFDIAGDNPRLAEYPDKASFKVALDEYRDVIVPLWDAYKAVNYYKVEACNDSGECSERSAADAGQSAYKHTAEYSDLAQLLINAAGYPALTVIAIAPSGMNALGWSTTIDGVAGGNVQTNVRMAGLGVNLVVNYNNYTEGQDRIVTINGPSSTPQMLNEALNGVYVLEANFTATGDFGEAQLNQKTRISYDATGQFKAPNEGTMTVTYNGDTFTFDLPI